MRYYVIYTEGYIDAVGVGTGGEEIDEEAYTRALEKIRQGHRSDERLIRTDDGYAYVHVDGWNDAVTDDNIDTDEALDILMGVSE